MPDLFGKDGDDENDLTTPEPSSPALSQSHPNTSDDNKHISDIEQTNTNIPMSNQPAPRTPQKDTNLEPKQCE